MQLDQLNEALHLVYGTADSTQQRRYARGLEEFQAHYGHDGEAVHIFRAPGRVNVIGEHTDYNHGFVLPAALDKDILLFARPRPDGHIHLINSETDFAPVAFAVSAAIPAAPAGDWGNFARGAAQTITQALGRPAPGFDGLIVGAAPYGVPRGAGLSSSSALTVVVALALAHFADWQPPKPQLAQLCSEAEWYVGTRGGMMDQFAALLGQRNHALFLDCRPERNGAYRYETIPLPATHRLLVVDSGVHHHNVRGEFNQRVAACRAGVALLRSDRPDITHLRDVQSVAWSALEPLLPETITLAELAERGITLTDLPSVPPNTPLRVRACCRHVWSENKRVLLAGDALKLDETAEVGRLMNEAHTSARDDYRISTPELDLLVRAAREVDGCAGARLTGAGWGGCIVALVHSDAVEAFEHHITTQYQTATGQPPAIFPCHAGAGASLVCRIETTRPVHLSIDK